MTDIKLLGRVILTVDVRANTGLHIGGSSGDLEIGGVDNPVIRDPVTQQPYIPGSSLKGKIRSQLEKVLGASQNTSVGQATIHTCKSREEYESCEICQLFGAPGETEASYPTRLIVRDVMMTGESVDELSKANTDMAFTELKTEVAIDRVTSAASPRNIERVPAGTVFGPAEIVFSMYQPADPNLFKRLIEGLQLLEDDYLGGSGSRGSGKVSFINLKLTGRSGADYSKVETLGEFETVQLMADQFDKIPFGSLFKE